jgi:hypothetical protein
LFLKFLFKKCRKYQKGDFKEKRERPEHLNKYIGEDSESNESSSEEDGAYAGMSAAACHLGIGAALYLQILKTFVILFVVLTIINIPIIGLYANSSKFELRNYEEIFAYFTLGNLGRGQHHCGYQILKI